MLGRKVIQPEHLSEHEKIEYLANMGYGDIYPTAFADDNELSLISMLARRILALEKKIDDLIADLREACDGSTEA